MTWRSTPKVIHLCTKARWPASKAPLCSQSVISSSQQALNSAPLTALSPTEAIKSTLIPHSTTAQEGAGGGGSVRATTHKHRLCTNTLPDHKALAPGVTRWNTLTANKQNWEGSEQTSFWLWPHSDTWCGTVCKFKGLYKWGSWCTTCWPVTALSSHPSCCREDNEHHFYSTHATGFHSCVDIKERCKISPAAH